MFRSNTILIVLLSIFIAGISTHDLHAQRGGGGGGGGERGGRGGGGGGRGGGGSTGGGGSDFRARIMERMDRNGNGKIEEDEISDRSRGFVEGMARTAGVPIKYPLTIASISGGSSSNSTRSKKSKAEEKEFEYPLVAGFGNAEAMGFGMDPNMYNGRRIEVDAVYDDRVKRQLDSTMGRYDKDANGVLEYEEWIEVPWTSDPRVSDVDKDGRLTRAEMAERLKKNSGGSRSTSSQASSGRGGGTSGRGGGATTGRGGGRGGTTGGRGGRGGGDTAGGGGRGGRGGGDTGGRGGGFTGFDPTMMLQRFAKDGQINFDKMDDRVKGFATRMLGRYGIEPKGTVSLESIKQKIAAGAGGGGNANAKKKVAEVKIPPSKRIAGADRYDGNYSYREAREEADWALDLEDRDKNGDGQVSLAEFFTSKSASQRKSELKEFNDIDSNRDGIVTPAEAEAEEKSRDRSKKKK